MDEEQEVRNIICTRCRRQIPSLEGSNLVGSVLKHYWMEHPEALLKVDREQIRAAATMAEFSDS